MVDSWLDQICPFRVFRLSAEQATRFTAEAGILQRDGFYHVKSRPENVTTNAQLLEAGFFLVDTTVTFEWSRTSRSAERTGRDNVVVERLSSPHQQDAIDLARRSFQYSRFHQDPLIPNPLANEINAQWVNDYFVGARGEGIAGAFHDGRLIGFDAVLKAQNEPAPTYVIDLIAVDPEYQGEGTGSALIARCINDISATHAPLRVGTQVSNIPAVRAYENMGFRLVEAQHVFHAHVRDGKLLRPMIDPPWSYRETSRS